jgi:hypothetical protein
VKPSKPPGVWSDRKLPCGLVTTNAREN